MTTSRHTGSPMSTGPAATGDEGYSPAAVGYLFGAASVSAHETGHTLTNAAFGGFFYWINAMDENIVPARGAAAYGGLIPESHFGSGFSPPRRFLPMW